MGFCSNCGSAMPDAATMCANCGHINAAAFCGNCGSPIAATAEVCPNCGQPNELRAPAAVLTTSKVSADFWIRFGALFIDLLICGVIGRLLPEFRVHVGSRTRAGLFFGFGSPFGSATYFLYSWLLIGLNGGRTVGCMATGLRVAQADGVPLSLATTAGRQAMAIVSSIPLALGYLWAAWDPENRTWHDMVVNSRVFRER
ncbi:MAG: RDD family protein [Actinomycetota bacterium]|nr:RDD family protein [Actinomycetota bacterium]